MDFRNIKTEETVMSKTDTCKKKKRKKKNTKKTLIHATQYYKFYVKKLPNYKVRK